MSQIIAAYHGFEFAIFSPIVSEDQGFGTDERIGVLGAMDAWQFHQRISRVLPTIESLHHKRILF